MVHGPGTNWCVWFQFGALLDDNAGSKFDNVGMNAMANRDKAGRTRLDPVWTRSGPGLGQRDPGRGVLGES